MSFSYLVVEGPIGVGKTTLMRRLAEHYHADLLDEKPSENPFLERFYEGGPAEALPTQLCFLVQRARQVDELRQGSLFSERVIADFLFDKDQLFASLTLSEPEFALYNEIFTRFAWHAPTPDAVIYLHAPLDCLMERIAKRARPAEKSIQSAYVSRVAKAYQGFFANYHQAPVVSVDTSELNLVDGRADFEKVLAAVDEGIDQQHRVHI